MGPVQMAALGTGFTCLMTAAGAAVVFFFKKEIAPVFQRVFLGFAAGVMTAASVWSLLLPAIDRAVEQGQSGWVQAAGGFLMGALFLVSLDALRPLVVRRQLEGGQRRTALLVLAITLHNIPEGMAVGLACALAASSQDAGQAAGWVEPLMPWLLSFAAGAMVYVVAQELIPEARRDETSRAGTWGVLLGFVIMMVMDVALG